MKEFGFHKNSLTAFFIKHGLLQKNEVIVKWECTENFLSIYVEGEEEENLEEDDSHQK